MAQLFLYYGGANGSKANQKRQITGLSSTSCRGGRRATGHEKHARRTCFSCPVGGESAGEGGKAAQHKEYAHMGTFFVLGCRGTRAGAGEPPNTKNATVCRVFRVQQVGEL